MYKMKNKGSLLTFLKFAGAIPLTDTPPNAKSDSWLTGEDIKTPVSQNERLPINMPPVDGNNLRLLDEMPVLQPKGRSTAGKGWPRLDGVPYRPPLMDVPLRDKKIINFEETPWVSHDKAGNPRIGVGISTGDIHAPMRPSDYANAAKGLKKSITPGKAVRFGVGQALPLVLLAGAKETANHAIEDSNDMANYMLNKGYNPWISRIVGNAYATPRALYNLPVHSAYNIVNTAPSLPFDFTVNMPSHTLNSFIEGANSFLGYERFKPVGVPVDMSKYNLDNIGRLNEIAAVSADPYAHYAESIIGGDMLVPDSFNNRGEVTRFTKGADPTRLNTKSSLTYGPIGKELYDACIDQWIEEGRPPEVDISNVEEFVGNYYPEYKARRLYDEFKKNVQAQNEQYIKEHPYLSKIPGLRKSEYDMSFDAYWDIAKRMYDEEGHRWRYWRPTTKREQQATAEAFELLSDPACVFNLKKRLKDEKALNQKKLKEYDTWDRWYDSKAGKRYANMYQLYNPDAITWTRE